MTGNIDLYLQPTADGLLTRKGHPYARNKLRALAIYAGITNNAMHKNPNWSARIYIDLQAGPGKNHIGKDIILGSPLLALGLPNPATHFFFNDFSAKAIGALKERISASPYADRVTLAKGDLNKVVDDFCIQIRDIPRSLKLAFLDPEGLEVEWTTVEKLAHIPSTDLIINFSTSGIRRSYGKNYHDVIDRFFGTKEWRDIFENPSAHRPRALIDLYLSRLHALGYHSRTADELPAEIVAKNSRNAEVYSIIFASRNELGDKFWRQAEKRANQPRLL